MIALARIFSHPSTTETETGTPRIVSMFCGAGLLVSLLFASLGVELGAEFF